MLTLALFVEGLETPEDIIGLDHDKIERAAYRAINYTAGRARSASAEHIAKQINFPASYLLPSQGRLTVSRKAGPGSLEATILGRHRATSLARFVTGGAAGKMGVSVAVKPGENKTMKRAFLMNLRSGKDIDTAKNLGLAVRTNGEAPSGAYKPVRINDSLYLLYGPSVNQVFKSVRVDVMPDAEKDLDKEFRRLLALEMKG